MRAHILTYNKLNLYRKYMIDRQFTMTTDGVTETFDLDTIAALLPFGEFTTHQLSEVTGIPFWSMTRPVKILIEAGVIAYVHRGGVNIYRRVDQPTSHTG